MMPPESASATRICTRSTVVAAIGDDPRETRRANGESPFLEMKNPPDVAMTVSDWTHRAQKSGAKFRNGDTWLARITPCLENGKVGYVDFSGTSPDFSRDAGLAGC
jgi:hypothetical protein